ncbi:MAG: ATP-binding protein [Candidatus Xenobiia bacterium LiM19]
MTDYFEREITSTLLESLATMPVVVLTGMRQVGKSTLLLRQKELKNRNYITLDSFAHLEAAKRNPRSLLDNEYCTIDEVQKCPELLVAIKQEVDRDRKPGRFLLSGSANLLLMKGVTESLAGRAVYLTLHPFSRREKERCTDTVPFLKKLISSDTVTGEEIAPHPLTSAEILSGGMPTLCCSDIQNPSLWFLGFEQTYLERDLRDLSQIADLLSFRNLMKLAALRTGQVLNVSEIARDARLNSPTCSRYLNLMAISFIIHYLTPYLRNSSRRIIKSPKIYFTDSGIGGHCAGVTNMDITSEEPLRGALFETYAAQNLKALLEYYYPGASLHFWNIQGRHEVDCIIEYGRKVLAIEIKASERWHEKDLGGLKAFLSTHTECSAALLAYNGTETVKLDDRLMAVPLGRLLS